MSSFESLVQDIYPLTPMQEGMLFYSLSDPLSSAYFDQLSYHLHGQLDERLIKNSLDELFKRYDILRTAFIHEGVDRPLQVVLKKREAGFHFEDLREKFAGNHGEQEAYIKEYKKKDRQRSFDLTKDVLMRISVLQTGEEEYEFIWSSHHILMDGWCTGILIADFFEIYNSFLENRDYRLAKVTPYRVYIQWLEKQDREKSKIYWGKYLQSYEEAVSVPKKNIRKIGSQEYKNERVHFAIDREKTGELNNLAGRNNVTLNTIIQAVWGIVLSKYNGKEDVVFGAVVSGRPDEIPGIESMVGLFINAIPVRIICREKVKFNELLHAVQEQALQSDPHHYYPLAEIQAQSTLKQDLLDHILVFENFPIAEQLDGVSAKSSKDSRGVKVAVSRLETFEQTNYDFNMIIGPTARINIRFLFNGNIYDRNFVERIGQHFTHVIGQILDNEEITPADLTLLSEEEKKQILFDFNDTWEEYPQEKTLQQLFEEQVEKTPDHIAMVKQSEAGRCALTYRELNEKSNRLAHLLRSRGIRGDSIVGLLVDRSFAMVTAVLAIMKAGGAYLPLDPQYPQKRIMTMIEDSGLPLLLTEESHLRNFHLASLKAMNTNNVVPVVTPPRPQIKDFDRLPKPDRTLINYEKYHPFIGIAMAKHTISIQATRGCPFNCAYCHKIWPKNHVSRSAENIFEEILYSYKAGVRRFVFIDDVFNLDQKNTGRLLQKMIAETPDVRLFFPNGLRGDILTKDFIDLMVEAETVNIDLALESASPRIQKLINKNLNLDRFRENSQYITEKYPHVLLEMELMIGFPTETEEEALMTLDFLKSIEWVHFPNLNILKIYPNTGMAKLAVENGISEALIEASASLAYHELPETLPFSKSFTKQYQTRFLNEYFLLKERLLHVLPLQMRTLTGDELIQKYDSYLPVKIGGFDDILRLADITRQDLGEAELMQENCTAVPGYNDRMKPYFPSQGSAPGAMRILLLDLTLLFSDRSGDMMYDMIEEPLGLMYLMSYINEKFGQKVSGKIAKSRIDFDSFAELKTLIIDFKPDLIGIRTLSFYRDFFHETLSFIRQWGIRTPVVAGGPYATSDYRFLLQDTNVDLVVLGEGELTLAELIEKMLQDDKKLPGDDVLKQIPGIAFIKDEDKPRLRQLNREVLFVDHLSAELARLAADNIENINQPGDLAYVIYTSGSTGRPKGVMLEHGNLVNLIRFHHRHININNSAVLQFSTISFDASFHEIFSALLAGGKLLIIDEELRTDIPRLFRQVEENKIKTVFLPISFLKIVFSEEEYIDMFPSCIEHIQTAGEQVVVSERFARFLKENSIYLHNHYGPAETHVVTTYTVDPAGDIPELPPIGKPIMNTDIYILDQRLNILSIGVPGELYIGGLMVGRGYFGRENLTRERFIDSPFKPGEILYKTGDLARWLADGNIDFLGRVDHQVKIRGFRIEPGEIESRLLSHPLVKEAIVVPFEKSAYGVKKGEKFLCAYIVGAESKNQSQQPAAPDVSDLRQWLSRDLPDFMIPSYFVSLAEIPLTPNGKVNRRALPEPGVEEAGVKYTPPRNEVEEKLVEIWSAVLGIDKDMIGIDSNFFELGGHSLKAIILVSRIKKEFEVEFSLDQVFRSAAIRECAKIVNKAKKSIYDEIKPVEKRDYYPQSSAQKRLYFLDQFEDVGTSYNLPSALLITGKPEKDRYEEAFKSLILSHESLRTSFEIVNNEPMQKIYDHVDFKIEEIRLEKEHVQAEDFKQIMKKFIRPFNLSQAPLLRAGLVPLPGEEYFLLYDMHHIISDGTSIGIMSSDFIRVYLGEQLPPSKIQYKDFSLWQNGLIKSGRMKKSEDFWLELYQEEITRLNLPLDYPRPNIISFAGGSYDFKIGSQETARFKELASDNSITLYMNLLAVLNVLLVKYTDQDDIIIGSGIIGRPHADLQQIIGMFVNTLAMRNHPAPWKTYLEFLRDVKNSSIRAFENQDVQFADLVDKLNPERNPSRNPLFDICFVLQNYEESGEKREGVRFVPYAYEDETSKFDMTITAFERKDEILINMEYCSALYKRETMKRLAGHFINLVRAVNEKPGSLISELDILSEEEKKLLLYDFNDTISDYPKEKTIHEIFTDQVVKTPDNIAVVGMEHGANFGAKHSVLRQNGKTSPLRSPQPVHITYRDLDRESGRLAVLLIERGVEPGTVAGIMLEQSTAMIVGILAILKAGGAYLPVDTDYPQERKYYMLEDSGTSVLVTSRALAKEVDKLVNPRVETVFVEEIGPGGGARRAVPSDQESMGHTADAPKGRSGSELAASSSNLAYIMYTSGSTGRAKGVMVDHQNVTRLVINTNFIDLSAETRVLQTGAPVFDATTFEMWGPLLNGGRLYLVDKKIILDADQLGQAIKRDKITTLWLSSPLFNQLTRQNSDIFSTLSYLLVGGDVLSPPTINTVRNKNKKLNIINGYGPTENTTFSTTYLIDKDFETPIPIGSPIANSTVIILDKCGHLRPIGVYGELWVGGDGVSRGYMNDPQLTMEKYDRDTFFKRKSLYSTGDLARWLPDGNVEFIGRLDHQVKIRGFRVEMGEIESQLLAHENIKEAVVLAKEDQDGGKYLCAFLVAQSAEPVGANRVFARDAEPSPKGSGTPEVDASKMREFLSHTLPDYMIPSYFVFLDNIPLNLNGKVDRKALPEPERAEPGGKYAAPRNELEESLAKIWAEILFGSDTLHASVGIDDDFFELGGHSLKATALLAQIHKELNVKVPLTEIFTTPTIRGLSGYLQGKAVDRYVSIAPAEKKEYYVLSSAQKRMYVLQQLESGGTAYNIPQNIVLKAEPDKEKLAQTFRKLVKRHESLRTSFKITAGEPVQEIHNPEDVIFEIEYYSAGGTAQNKEPVGANPVFARDSGHGPRSVGARRAVSTEIPSPGIVHDLVRQFIRPFDLSTAPLLRVGLLVTEEGKYILMVDMHHIISDGLSIGILIREFMTLDAGRSLPENRIQYKDYAQWQIKEKERGALKEQEMYWLTGFAGEIPVLNLPTDYPRPEIKSYAGSEVVSGIEKDEAKSLNRMALAEGATLYMVLLAIFNILLAKLSTQEDIIVGTPTAGRRRADLEKMIGMFVNTLALRNYPAGEKTFKEFLKEVKETTLTAFENQDYQFEDLVEKVEVARDTGRNALFSIMFALQEVEVDPGKKREEEKKPGLNLRQFSYAHRISKFDITLTIVKKGEELFLTVQYCTDLFKKETIERFVRYFKRILTAALEEPQQEIYEMEMMSDPEKAQILFGFNDTKVDYPADKTAPVLFDEQVVKTPDNIAVVGMGHNVNPGGKHSVPGQNGSASPLKSGNLTYRELGREADTLAGILIKKGVKPGTIVGIMVRRSLEMIAGILGIMRAGGAYLPIDCEYPAGRKRFLIEDSRVTILLTTRNLAQEVEKLGSLQVETIFIEESRGEPLCSPAIAESAKSKAQSKSYKALRPAPCAMHSAISPENLAYVIYTSGTTGSPKAVMIEHRSLSNLVSGLREKIYSKFSPNLRVSLLAPYMFDASIKQIFAALLLGCTLHIVPEETRVDGNALVEYYLRNKIDISDGTPTHLRVILESTAENTLSLYIKHLIIGGEVLPQKIAKGFLNSFAAHPPTITNIYGTAECCVDSTFYELTAENVDLLDMIPVGKPLPNSRVYIVDKYLELLPLVVPGEICISGAGVGRGYLNRPELTAEKFISAKSIEQKVPGAVHAAPVGANLVFARDPHHSSFITHHSAPLYKTGDLARWLPDGNIEFLGRIDHQVKIRGFRIELSEIEHRILKHKNIKDVVVLASEASASDVNVFGVRDINLCAYIVTKEGISLSIPEIREFLSVELPDYMIPSFFLSVEKIPLTSQGKLDRKTLATYGISLDTGVEYVEPESDNEKIIADAWKEVLQIEKVGIHDNFFEIGGNSLKIIQLSKQLKEAFDRDIPVVTLFRFTTVSTFARYLSQGESHDRLREKDRFETIERGKRDIKQRLKKRRGGKI